MSRTEQSKVQGDVKLGASLEKNPYVLPPDLPVPVDDGACGHLPGLKIPPVKLRSTLGRYVDAAEASQQPTVFFFYPHTGKPGELIGKEWDSIPGARGCTPQSCGFRDQYWQFSRLGFQVFGVSGQELDEQTEFAQRVNLPYGLLNDSEFQLVHALRLPTFEFRAKTFVKRLALVVRGARIERVFYPVFPPDKNAEIVLEYLNLISARKKQERTGKET